ncbi:hypothetical protein [Metabacillus niabensis]|uniref:Uncharacterized protein n=1 Tax=Metabacillus niabensis TaxID=324854 RepID=A0ABT9YZZ6_9BACI|nr:hypothetical protein [Metabacillus niabensis]MDQ0225568.1 hypothetical protein [Metabacillus niabensis]
MDDKQFEERMMQLKKSYESIPTKSAPDAIMKHIVQQEKPKKRKTFKLPYVASFIGVLLIGGLIGGQLISQQSLLSDNEEKNSAKITTEQVESAKNEIRGLFERKVDELGEKLDFAQVEQYRFIQDVEETVDRFEERSSYKNEKELKTYMKKVEEEINRRVSLPNEEYAYIKKKVEDNETIQDDFILDYLDKLDAMSENFTSEWRLEYNSGDVMPTKENVEGLNNKNLSVVSKEITNFADEIVTYGYRFNLEGEGSISIQINLDKIVKDFTGHISDELESYLYLKDYVQDVLDISKEQYDDENMLKHIVHLETFILQNENFRNKEDLKKVYHAALTHLIFDMDIDLLNKFTTQYPDALTTEVVKMALQHRSTNRAVNDELKLKIISAIPAELRPIFQFEAMYLLPLPDYLERKYKEFKASKDYNSLYTFQAFKGTYQFSIVRIYLYAIMQEDYETAYALSYNGKVNGKDATLPDFNTFKTEMSSWRVENEQLLNDLVYVDEGQYGGGLIFLYTFINDNGEKLFLEMHVDENLLPKIVYPPSS